MTFLLLIIWGLSGSSISLGDPWSAWFIALIICALLDLGGGRVTSR